MRGRRGFKTDDATSPDRPGPATPDPPPPNIPDTLRRLGHRTAHPAQALPANEEDALMHDLTPPTNWPAWVLAWVAAMVLWMPVMRGLAWVTIWVAYLAGQTPDPPPAYTLWTP